MSPSALLPPFGTTGWCKAQALVVAHICVQGGSGEREIWDSLLTFRTDEKEALWDRSAPMGASLPALREGSAVTPFGAVLRESSGGKSTRLGSVLGTELVYPLSPVSQSIIHFVPRHMLL